jgi:hypothetical protein
MFGELRLGIMATAYQIVVRKDNDLFTWPYQLNNFDASDG